MSPNRRDARRMAMYVVYSMECTGYDVKEALDLTLKLKSAWSEFPEFTTLLCNSYWEHRKEIDGILKSVLENWKLDRVAPVERALLKLGCSEIVCFDDIPPRVTINEYIELSKQYADDNAPGFINGILDRIVKVRQKPDK